MKKKSGATPAVDALVAAGVPYTLHEYAHDPGTTHFGEETVAVLGLDPARVLKTLVAEVPGGRRPELVVGVVPVAGRLDLKALATALGAKKAEMADPAAAERSSGYVVGGISPLGQKTRLRTVIDSSATAFDTVYVSAGRRGMQVELSPADLVALTGAVLAPVGR